MNQDLYVIDEIMEENTGAVRMQKRRDLVQAEEKRGAPGESPGEDMNGHWLDTKGGREGSGQENCMNTSMDSIENMGHVLDEEESPRD